MTPTVTEFDVNVSAVSPTSDSTKIPQLDSTGNSPAWNIQLTGTLQDIDNISMYEVDLFDTDASTIENLKNSGKIVICYFNGGAWENWRSDADDFPSEVLGNDMSGWPGEKWLDITNTALIDIMEARLDLAVTKGCDGVDPDNMNGYLNNTGFDLSTDDQLAYNRYMANAARLKGLSVALKNDTAQIDDLVEYFDFAVNEECFEQDYCDGLDTFIDNGKPVFNVEYDLSNTTRDDLCNESTNIKKFSTLIMPYELDGTSRDACIE